MSDAPNPGAEESGAPSGEASAPDIASLPGSMRRRIAQYVGSVLHDLEPGDIPGALRPALGWRRGAMPAGFQQQVLAAVGEEGFRERLAAVLGEKDEIASAFTSGGGNDQREEANVGALLFLLRPEGWQERLRQVLHAPTERSAPTASRAEQEIDELRRRLQSAKQRRQRDLAAAVSEAAEVQRQQAATIERLREQLAEANRAWQDAEQARADVDAKYSESERTLRRLRGQIERLSTEVEQLRAAQRAGRIGANSRAKVLLEVLQGSVTGLAEELGLPSSTPAPADLVPARPPEEPELPLRLHSGEALLTALSLPRCHLLVDGYNISKGLWPALTLQQQRDRLVAALRALQSRTSAEVTVVFDGADVAGVPSLAGTAVRVRFSPPGEPADRVLVALVAAEPSGRPMVVASSDNAVASGARRAGARSVDREVLAELLPG